MPVKVVVTFTDGSSEMFDMRNGMAMEWENKAIYIDGKRLTPVADVDVSVLG